MTPDGRATVIEVLTNARDLIAKGWCQDVAVRGSVFDPEAVCAFGALTLVTRVAGSGTWWQHVFATQPDVHIAFAYQNALETIATTLTREYPEFAGTNLSPTDQIALWNDAPGRTQDEVLAIFDKAIAGLEETR